MKISLNSLQSSFRTLRHARHGRIKAWQPVAPGIDHERAGIGMDVLERNPNAAHIAGRVRRQVDRILMDVLLAAVQKIQRLAWQRNIVKESRENPDDTRVRPEAARRLAVLKEVLDALALVTVPKDPLGQAMFQVSHDLIACPRINEPVENEKPLLQEMTNVSLILSR